jgi:hypothetical protein
VEIGILLLIGLNWSRKIVPAINRVWQANFCYQLIGLLLSVICNVRPIEMDKPHILA